MPLQFQNSVYLAAKRKLANNKKNGNMQVTHGDLSPGNVLFLENDKAIFCDFEDTCFAYRSVCFDIAMVLARFCLTDVNSCDDSTAKERLDSFSSAYGKFGKKSINELNLKTELQEISDHFLIVMSSLAFNGVDVDYGEWRKAQSWPFLAEKIQ